ncbi:MAG: hypothetical protein ACRC80_32095 [Waterburya sp.]
MDLVESLIAIADTLEEYLTRHSQLNLLRLNLQLKQSPKRSLLEPLLH